MKKYSLFLFISFFSILNFAQNIPDLKEIKKNVTDVSSPFFYEKLVYQFNFNPGNTTAIEAEHLYYGKAFANYKLPFSNQKEISRAELNDLIREKKFEESIAEGEIIVRNSPADLEILGLLMYSFLQDKNDNQELAYLRGYQFHKLLDAVLKSRSGTEKNPLYTVTSIPDEYVIAGILKLDLKKFRRKTTYNSIGALDVWKKGKDKISFQVVFEDGVK